MRAMNRVLGRNDNASVAGLVDVGSYSACIVDKENQRIPYGRVKISREVQVIRQDLSGAPAGLEFYHNERAVLSLGRRQC